jgi:hypothetical protein
LLFAIPFGTICPAEQPLFCPAEPPFFVLPSVSEASLASFGTTSPPHFVRDGIRDVIPRRVSAEGPLACARGDKKRLGVTASHRVFPRHAFLFVIPRRVSAERPLGLRLGATKKERLGATASHRVFSRHASLFVIPRHASAEGPLTSLIYNLNHVRFY